MISCSSLSCLNTLGLWSVTVKKKMNCFNFFPPILDKMLFNLTRGMTVTFSSVQRLVSVSLSSFGCDTTHRLLHFLLRPASWPRLQRGGSWELCCHACFNWFWSHRLSSSSSLFCRPGGEPVSQQVCCQTTLLSQLLHLWGKK